MFWDLGLLLFFWVAYEMEMFLSYPFVCGASSGGPAALCAWDLGPCGACGMMLFLSYPYVW